VFAAAGVVGGYLVGGLVVDPDLWGHVAFGKAIVAAGLPELDPYSYTAGGHPWINHEVGAELAFGWLHAHLGPAGLQLLRYGLVGLVVGLLWREQIRAGQRWSGAALVTALLVVPMGSGFSTVRPHLFTYAFFLLVLLCLVRGDRTGSRWPWVVPLLIALWVNVHGGALAGVGVVGLWWGAKVAASSVGSPTSGFPARRAFVVLLLSLAALAVNPYGQELPRFLLATATVPRPEITEWAPVTQGWSSLSLWLMLTAGSGWLLLRRGGGRPPVEHMAVLAALTLLPLMAHRHLPLYAIGCGVLLAPHVPDFAGRHLGSRRERLRAGHRPHALEAVLVATCALVGAAGFAVAGGLGSFPCIPLPSLKDGDLRYPQRAVRVLQEGNVSGDLATPFGWGEYAIWQLAPDIRVGMDGRRETVYPDSVYRAFLRYRAGVDDWDDWLDDYAADMALVEAGSPPDNLLELEPRWREIHRDEVAALYGRRTWAGSELLAAASADDAGFEEIHCFPREGPSPAALRQRAVSSSTVPSD
jgi:hypothetical protein